MVTLWVNQADGNNHILSFEEDKKELSLSVCKPDGTEKKMTVKMQATRRQLERAFHGLGPTWYQSHVSNEGGRFTASRIVPIQETGEIITWFVDHKHNGENYVLNDTLVIERM